MTYGEKDHAVTSISGALAAVDCGGMSSLTIPASVGYVGAGFAAELPIESISVAEDSEYYVSIDGVLYSSSADCIIKYPNAKSGAEYVIPASVREIAGGAFVGCTQLGKVVFEGDAPEVRPAGSDKPSFDAEAVTLYCDPARSGWLDSEDYDADARTWMGYKLRRIGDSGVSVSGEVSFYDGSSAATVTLVQDGEAAYEITLAPSDEVGQNVRAFEITDVEDGVYDLVITAEGHLSFTVTGINVSGENVDLTQSGKAELSTITLVAGDVNRDGCVDLKDVTLLTSFNTYGRTYSDAETKSADINGDKCFDLKDLTIITSEKNYGKSPVKIEY